MMRFCHRAALTVSFSFLTLLILLSDHVVQSAKIGIFTAPLSNSQMIFNIRVAEVLADDGHDVVIIRPNINPKSTKLASKHPKVREIRIDALKDPLIFQNFSDFEHQEIFGQLSFGGYMDLSNLYRNMMNEACNTIINDDNFIAAIREEKIELAFHHHVDFCQLGLIHHVGIKKFVMTMAGPPESSQISKMGVPVFPSIYPVILMNSTVHMSFIERAKSLFASLLFKAMQPYQMEYPQTAIHRAKFGKDFPSIEEIRSQALMNFINADALVEFPLLRTEKIQFIGGIGTSATKNLVEPFLSFVNNSKKVVIVSFGSVAISSDMPMQWRNAFLGLFEKNPDISFIWKFEEDIPVPANVLRTNWLPQNDILAHEKCVTIITHGGYNSLGEVISAGKPALLVPLFADQFRNSRLAEWRGFGIQLVKDQLSPEYLNNNLQKVLNDDKYIKSSVALRNVVNSKPLKSEDNLKYWTKFLLTHENYNMELPQLNFIQLVSLDVILSVVGVVLFVLFGLKKILMWYYWSCFEMSYKTKEKLQ